MTQSEYSNKNGLFSHWNFGFVCILCLGICSFLSTSAMAQQAAGSDEHGQDASAAQAQATMASLFGRGAKMPGIPRINGTIALPAFDSSGMTIDEGALKAAQERRPETRDQRRTQN